MEDSGETRDRLASEEALNEAMDLLEQIENAKVRCDFSRVRSGYEKKVRRYRRMRSIRNLAAAVVLLISMGGIWLFTGRGRDAIQKMSGDVILSLADGTQINLGQSARLEKIADYANIAVMSTSGGGIEYVRKGTVENIGREILLNTLTIPRGNRYDIILEDGTHVWLNSGSQLRFPAEFTGDERRVYLQGEAYFDVTPDAENPFIVETSAQTLKVLGTEFNICAYPDEAVTQTTLVEGSVEVASKRSESKVVLVQGQQSRLGIDSREFVIQNADINETGLWREGAIVFGGNTLEGIFRDLSRWYDFEYRIESEEIANLRLSGDVPVYDNIDRILRQIEALGQVAIEQHNKMITIKAKR